MKVVILAGGLGTRLREETEFRPKPMVEIGGKPMLWHIMKIYSSFGINEFIVCGGYKIYSIIEYFKDFQFRNNDIEFDLTSGTTRYIKGKKTSKWKVSVVDTGNETQTGGRLKQIETLITEDNFMCTYGDGVSDLNIADLLDFHLKSGSIATVTAVRPLSRFGSLQIEGSRVKSFDEKKEMQDRINGGFFVFKKEIFKYLKEDSILEGLPMQTLANEGQLSAFEYNGFWQPMDTYREFKNLNTAWELNEAHWTKWWNKD